MQIILDISANTHQNDEKYYRKMIEAVHECDVNNRLFISDPLSMKEIIIKGQLFREAGKNIPQHFGLFERMMNWTYRTYGYKTTASVFDTMSLDLLLLMNIPYKLPFIKIANDSGYDWLIGEIPRKIAVYKSVTPYVYWGGDMVDAGLLWAYEKKIHLLCVSNYPATATDYLKDKPVTLASVKPYAISDHTIGTDFVKEQKPQIYECHFVLEHDPNNLDGGEWAKTPDQLKEILECI